MSAFYLTEKPAIDDFTGPRKAVDRKVRVSSFTREDLFAFAEEESVQSSDGHDPWAIAGKGREAHCLFLPQNQSFLLVY